MKNKSLLLVIVGAILVVILIVVAFNMGSDNLNSSSSRNIELSNDPQTVMDNAKREAQAAEKKSYPDLVEIDIDSWLNLYAGEEKSLVFLARPTCSFCQIATPIIKEIVKEYGVDIKYLNTDNFDDDAQTKFVHSDEEFNEGYGTPMLLLVGNNSLISKVDGLTDKAHYIDFLESNGFIE